MSRHHHKKSTQLVIDDTLIIPCEKPDIECLLRMTATPNIDKTVAADKKIIFSGHILLCIEYVARVSDGTQPIHFISFKLPIEGIICHRCARTDMNIQLQGAVEIYEFQVIDPKNVKISMKFKACSVRLARACKPLPPHLCKPCTQVYNRDNLR